MSEATEVYARALLGAAPRVLGSMDREPLSPTEGCCDRTWWAWKFVDFPAPRFQESVCFLSYLHATDLPGSPYRGNANLLGWIGAALRFWASRQHADGSFDEAYPYERSLAATAFTSFYVSEALGFLGDALDPALRDATRASLERAGRWLLVHDETHGMLSNHLAAAAAALHHVGRITGVAAFESRARFFLDRILARQSDEGWYEEYGGADPGYQTHGSFYLARYAELADDAPLLDSLSRATRFLAHFVHPDGSLGGEYASRNTQTYYPAAFEMLAPKLPEAAWIAGTLRAGVGTAGAAGIACVDAYNVYPMLNNLVFAHRACSDPQWRPAPPEEPAAGEGTVRFPSAGLVRVRTPRYDAVVATSKGGVLKVWDRAGRRLVYSDCGYAGRVGDRGLVATQYDDPARPVQVEERRVRVEGGLVAVSRPTFTPVRFLGFRLFSLTAGRLGPVARWLKALLVHVLVYRRRELDLRFERRIAFEEEGVAVRDRLRGGVALRELRWCERFATIHMGSSRYFVANELEPAALEPGGASAAVDPARLADGVELERRVRIA